jgi:AAA family ATP:ADP antiporter
MVYFVWFSGLHLFGTMVFWALMADRFSLEQSKRLFGIHQRGRDAGRDRRTLLASRSWVPGTAGLLPVAAASRVARVCCRVGRDRDSNTRSWSHCTIHAHSALDGRAIIGGSAGGDSAAVFGSPYLLVYSAYVLILTVISTFIYFTRLQMVAALGTTSICDGGVRAHRLLHPVSTLVLQAVVTGQSDEAAWGSTSRWRCCREWSPSASWGWLISASLAR